MPTFEYVRVSHHSNRLPGGKWELTTVAHFTDGSSVDYPDQDHALAKLGQDGWELVTATLTADAFRYFGSLYLKRQVED